MNEELKLKIKNTNHLRLNSADKEIVKEYTNFLPEDATFQERYYYIRNDIREQLRCPICGKPRRFNSKKTEMKKYCSRECNIADQKNISKILQNFFPLKLTKRKSLSQKPRILILKIKA